MANDPHKNDLLSKPDHWFFFSFLYVLVSSCYFHKLLCATFDTVNHKWRAYLLSVLSAEASVEENMHTLKTTGIVTHDTPLRKSRLSSLFFMHKQWNNTYLQQSRQNKSRTRPKRSKGWIINHPRAIWRAGRRWISESWSTPLALVDRQVMRIIREWSAERERTDSTRTVIYLTLLNFHAFHYLPQYIVITRRNHHYSSRANLLFTCFFLMLNYYVLFKLPTFF